MMNSKSEIQDEKHLLLSQREKVLSLWVEALRSGEYVQTRNNSLYDNQNDSYCCLGVLCDVVSQELEIGEWMENEHDSTAWTFDALGESKAGAPPTSLTASLMMGTSFVWQLVRMNDTHGYTFVEIADQIEKWRSQKNTKENQRHVI